MKLTCDTIYEQNLILKLLSYLKINKIELYVVTY